MIVDNAHGKRGRYQAIITTKDGRKVKGPLRYTIAEAQQDEGVIKTIPTISDKFAPTSKSILPVLVIGGLAAIAYYLSR